MESILKFCKGSKESLEDSRIVYASNLERNERFPNNRVSNQKYSVWSFVPKNLMEQFSRAMNRYFLVIALLQLWPLITPVDPITTIGPLVFIFLLTAVKEGFDDWHRYKSDLAANTKQIVVYRDGQRAFVASQDISVGDIVFVEEDDEIPCDLVMLKSSDPSGQAYLMTANIDGETNLKTRQARAETLDMNLHDIQAFTGVIECALPNSEVYRFDSRMLLSPRDHNQSEANWIPLSSQQTLLQACHLRNTDWVYGVAVYTGNETKVGMNKRSTPTKWSHADKFVDSSVFYLFCSQITLVVILGLTGDLFKEFIARKMPYLRYLPEQWSDFIIIPLRQLLLMSVVIPISLKVTLDIVKYLYSMFVNWDVQMYDPESDTAANARNTAIAEDLGQVEHIFTDKTGTLTDNIMTFVKCSVNGVMYGNSVDCHDAQHDRNLEMAARTADSEPEVSKFFQCLAVCQSVVPGKRDPHTGKIKLKGSSPDELALCDAAEHFGCEFVGRTLDSITVSDVFARESDTGSGPGSGPGSDHEHVFELLQTLDFTSDRKRMSVLVKSPKGLNEGRHILFTKGADDVIFSRLAPGQDEVQENTTIHLETFAQMGLRTLVIACREVSAREVEEFNTLLHDASIALENREKLMEEAYTSIEHDLVLLGATAIEDKLQDQVPETIALLRKAGLRFWMLTGDKFSTAVQIATACNLMSPEPEGVLIKVTGDRPEDIEASLLEGESTVRGTSKKLAMVISGATLGEVLRLFPRRFLAVAMATDAVVCCRVTPEQKAEVVAHVKKEGCVCLSIGDGGNDVSMIQEAHVGVGIAGREGLQAARAADFSFSRFKFLSRLLMVHGRQAYRRTAFIAQYCFYKSIIIAFCQVFYGVYCGWSGSTFFNSLSIMLYNVFFTGMSLFFYAMDRDVPDEALLRYPMLYQDGVKGRFMNRASMTRWLLRAAYHGPVIFFTTMWIYAGYSNPYDGSTMDTDSISTSTFTALITLQMFTVMMESHYMTWMNQGIIYLSLLSYFLINMVYTSFKSFDYYSLFWRALSDPNYWFSVVLITVLALAPVVALKYWNFLYHPTPNEVVRGIAADARMKRQIEMRNSPGRGSGHGFGAGVSVGGTTPQIRAATRGGVNDGGEIGGMGVGVGDDSGAGDGFSGSGSGSTSASTSASTPVSVSHSGLSSAGSGHAVGGGKMDEGDPSLQTVRDRHSTSAGSTEPFLSDDGKEKHR